MKFGVVVFPGSNCDQDMVYVLEEIMQVEVVKLWHKETDLQGCDFICLPGGFSYGDYLRSGAIARFSPIMDSIVAHAKKGGYVWGICNGFQILTEAGLLEGALLPNTTQKYICKNVYIRPETKQSQLTQGLALKEPYLIPIAHGEGRYYTDPTHLEELKSKDLILFKYCNAQGEVQESDNPNGSLENIAGICNAERNVFGMMPHPERAADSLLGNTDGRAFFESILGNILA